MEKKNVKFCEHLTTLRKGCKMSQQDLALKIHVSQQCVSKWERGLIEPTLTFLWRLADVFEITLDELVGRKV